jgi:hypothetical protein
MTRTAPPTDAFRQSEQPIVEGEPILSDELASLSLAKSVTGK